MGRKPFELIMEALDAKILVAIERVDLKDGTGLLVLENLVTYRAVLIGDLKPEVSNL